MALLFVDSFDHYVTADVLEKWTAAPVFGTGASVTVGSGNGRRASNGLRLVTGTTHNANFAVQKVLAPGDATALVGLAVAFPAGAVGAAGIQLCSVREGVTSQVCVRVNADLTLSVLRGSHSGTVLGTTGTALSAGVAVYVELKVVIHPSAGTVALRLNGVPSLSLTGQNTRQTASTTWTSVAVGMFDGAASSTSSSTRNIDYDDLYVCDGTGAAPWNDFLGDCRVDARLPTAAGATTTWTPNTGANWAAVDDAAPDDDTTYTETSTVNAIDTFVVQDAPVVGALIYGVQHCLSTRKTDAGVASIAPVVRIGATDYAAAASSPGTTYSYALLPQAVSPATGVAWTEAEFNGAEFGYKRTA